MNVGVGATTGSTPSTIAQMADDAIAFVEALGIDKIDLLGFSIGSFVAQEIALTRAAPVERVVLASTAPQGAPGMHGWSRRHWAYQGLEPKTADQFVEDSRGRAGVESASSSARG